MHGPYVVGTVWSSELPLVNVMPLAQRPCLNYVVAKNAPNHSSDEQALQFHAN